MWGANGFRPYGEGHDPSSLINEILSLTPEGAATVLNRLGDKCNEPGNAPTDGAIDNFTDNAYQDLVREADSDWMEKFNTHFNFGK